MMSAMEEMPPTNLQGDYAGSCIACLRGTDTALAFTGEAEWHIAGLVNLGLDMDEATTVVEQYHQRELGAQPGMVLDGRHRMMVRVCADCVAKAKPSFPAPGVVALGIPEVGQR